MSDTARLFIAIKIEPERPLRKILTRLAVMGRAVKGGNPDNLHLTLNFLGETELSLVPQIQAAMQSAVSGHSPFTLHLEGLGVFPNARRPAVVWVGMQECEPLLEIAAKLGRLMKPLGFPPERRKFHPHVTVARIRSKPPAELAEMLAAEQSTDFGKADVSSIELYESDLRSTGARYVVLSQAELGDNST